MNIVLLILVFLLEASNHYESNDRWLIRIKSGEAHCLNDWWESNRLNHNQTARKKPLLGGWMAIEVPSFFSEKLSKLPCIERIVVDEMLESNIKIPNDPGFQEQSDMKLIGMPQAWDIATGGLTMRGDTIVVAVIDDGFQINHEDLSDNFWHNYKEVPDDGVDNDNNGYIDDFTGVNISTGRDNHPVLSHGTSVCGIIGANGNNAKGISGVNWNIKLLPISYDHHISSLIEAYQYVLNLRKKYNKTHGLEGAFIVAVNLSSGLQFALPEDFPLWCPIYDTLGTQGILSICSASNDHHNVEVKGDLPARCSSPYTIIVTNVKPNDELEQEAAFGRISIDLGAPGEHSLTTDTIDTYNYFRGTSAAAPHVTGTVALLYSVSCSNLFNRLDEDPGDVAIQIKNIILSAGASNPTLYTKTLSARRLQTDEAVNLLQEQCNDTAKSKTLIRFVSPNPTGTGEARLYFDASNIFSDTYCNIYNVNGTKVQSLLVSKEEYYKGFITINTKSLPFGLYFLTLVKGKQLDTSKLIVN